MLQNKQWQWSRKKYFHLTFSSFAMVVCYVPLWQCYIFQVKTIIYLFNKYIWQNGMHLNMSTTNFICAGIAKVFFEGDLGKLVNLRPWEILFLGCLRQTAQEGSKK